MTTPFLTYELLTPETSDPVIIRITGQRERGFKDFTASNGVEIWSLHHPQYVNFMRRLFVGGKTPQDDWEIRVPLADWPAVKQAIRELNEYYKEKDMNLKKIDEYNKMVRDIAALVEPVGYDLLVNPDATLTVTCKKPKVCVEWRLATTVYKNEMAGPCGQGELYRVVQFRVTGFAWETGVALYGRPDYYAVLFVGDCPSSINFSPTSKKFFNLLIGFDARDKFSCPVLLPEEVYSRLPEICAALERKANQGG